MAKRQAKRAKRTRKLTEALIDRICELVAGGCTITSACAEVGICRQTYHNWLKWGEERRGGLYRQFYERAHQAEAVALNVMARRVFAGEKNWVSAMTFLERRDPANWGRSDRMQHEHRGSLQIVMYDKADKAGDGRAWQTATLVKPRKSNDSE